MKIPENELYVQSLMIWLEFQYCEGIGMLQSKVQLPYLGLVLDLQNSMPTSVFKLTFYK